MRPSCAQPPIGDQTLTHSRLQYRRRKKEAMQEQQRLNVELSLKCQQLASESETKHNFACSLEDMLGQAQFFNPGLLSQSRVCHTQHKLCADSQDLGANLGCMQAETKVTAGLQAFADAMLELLQSLAPAHEASVLRGLLSRATAQLADGSGTGFVFLSKVRSRSACQPAGTCGLAELLCGLGAQQRLHLHGPAAQWTAAAARPLDRLDCAQQAVSQLCDDIASQPIR